MGCGCGGESFEEVMNKFKLRTGLILTNDPEEEIKVNSKKILVKPVWKWLLEDK